MHNGSSVFVLFSQFFPSWNTYTVVAQKLPYYTLVDGGAKALDLAKILHAKYFIPVSWNFCFCIYFHLLFIFDYYHCCWYYFTFWLFHFMFIFIYFLSFYYSYFPFLFLIFILFFYLLIRFLFRCRMAVSIKKVCAHVSAKKMDIYIYVLIVYYAKISINIDTIYTNSTCIQHPC